MKDFKDLKVWAKAHEVRLLVYHETRAFPKEELYGLTSQLRRATASVAARSWKVAVGGQMGSLNDFFRLLGVQLANSNITCS